VLGLNDALDYITYNTWFPGSPQPSSRDGFSQSVVQMSGTVCLLRSKLIDSRATFRTLTAFKRHLLTLLLALNPFTDICKAVVPCQNKIILKNFRDARNHV